MVFRELEGEAVLLNLDSGIYFGLDAIGTCIWQGLDRRDPLETIVTALVDAYDVDGATADADTRRLVAQLLDKGLLIAGEDARPPA